jgi:hypothetical protein
MLARKLSMVFFSAVLLAIPFQLALPGSSFAQTEPKKDAILKSSDITPKIFPETVFYRGKVAPVQMRNSAGIHFADDFYVLAGLVDNSGYATSVKEKYQGYFLAEVPIEINGQSLKPGSYGIGFLSGSKFVVTDLGANNVLEIAGQRDTELKRATPLQVLAAPEAGAFRLYLGRDFVTIKRAH